MSYQWIPGVSDPESLLHAYIELRNVARCTKEQAIAFLIAQTGASSIEITVGETTPPKRDRVLWSLDITETIRTPLPVDWENMPFSEVI